MSSHVEKPEWDSGTLSRLLASRWAGFWNPDYLQQVILPLLSLYPGARILDVGSGSGGLTFSLAQLVPNAQFIGVDITPKLVADAQMQAMALGLTNVHFREGDALNLPFDDLSFDAVVCQTLLIHLTEPLVAVREMSRVLKSGGSFMAAEYHTLSAEWPIDQQRMSLTDAEAIECARHTQLLINGFRRSGQGDLRRGGQVPFLALETGMRVIDVRINDRVLHAFPPFNNPLEHAARFEARTWLTTFADTQWRAWLENTMLAGGGSAADVHRFLSLLSEQQREALQSATDHAFVWLINPVLLLTIARK